MRSRIAVFGESLESRLLLVGELLESFHPPGVADTYYNFGASVAISDDYLVVGASGNGGDLVGSAVYVYDRSASPLSTPMTVIPNPIAGPGGSFGHSVAIFNDYVVVGDPVAQDSGVSAGAAYVFDMSAADPTVPMLQLMNPDPEYYDHFGFSVAIERNNVIVGAPHDYVGERRHGSVYLYDLNEPNPSLPQLEIGSDADINSRAFGASAAISDNVLVVGAAHPITYGKVHVFDINSDDVAEPIFVFENPNPQRGYRFAKSVDIDGTRIAVGASYERLLAVGNAYVYDLSVPDPTQPVFTFGSLTDPLVNQFGSAVAISGDFLVVSEPTLSQAPPPAIHGLAHVFDLTAVEPQTPEITISDFWPTTNGTLGLFIPVAITNDALLVGSPSASSIAESAGSAHLFSLEPTVPTVVDRNVIYNGSIHDGYDPAANRNDDDAIAYNVSALIPGETAADQNVLNYSLGVNGLMIDIVNLSAQSSLTPADFTFRTGRTDDPTLWATVPIDPMMTIRPGEGISGSDRITLTWPNGTITNTWLEVTVKANANTGLAEDDVFYFGNQIGDTNGDGLTNATDFAAIRANQTSFLNPAEVDNAFDINKDGLVNATDLLIVRDHFTPIGSGLPMITPSGPASLKAGSASELPVIPKEQSKQASIAAPVRKSNELVESDSRQIASVDAAILAEYGSQAEPPPVDDLPEEDRQSKELPLDNLQADLSAAIKSHR